MGRISLLAVVVLGLVLAACGGDDGGGGGGDGMVDVEPLNGLAGQDLHMMTPFEGGLFVARGMPTSAPMVVDGTEVFAISPGPMVHRAAALSDGPLHFVSGPNVYRADGTTATMLAQLSDTASNVFVDGNGGLFVVDGSTLMYGGTSGASFTEVPMGDIEGLSLVGPAARGANGSAYIVNALGNDYGILEAEAGGGGLTMAFDCNRQELNFCNAEGIFSGGLDVGDPIFLVSNVFAETGGDFYRIVGDSLVHAGHPPPEHTNVLSFTSAPDGHLFAVASIDNLARSDAFLYERTSDDGSWRLHGQLPGRGVISFAPDGTLYVATTTVGNIGGLAIIDL